jgi:hypothetical protein
MLALLANLAWGSIVLLAFVALGQLAGRLFRLAAPHDLFLAAGLGIAGMTVVGGLLNLFGVATSRVLTTVVLATAAFGPLTWILGTGGFAVGLPLPSPIPAERRQSHWVIVLVLLVFVKYATSLGSDFNPNDDQPAYLLQVSRMLQTGSIGLDPFSERQSLSLNGQTFLLGLVHCVSPFKYAFLLDPGICWIVIAGLTWSLIRQDLGGSIRATCLLTSLVLMVGLPFGTNLGGHLTGAVLYLTLIKTAVDGTQHGGNLGYGSLMTLAVIVAALCALKTTFLLFGVMFVVSWHVLRMLRSPSPLVVRDAAVIGSIATALLVPWMWQQYRSAGTPMYPFLGHGYHTLRASSEVMSDPFNSRARWVVACLMNGELTPAILALALLARGRLQIDRGRWLVLFSALSSVCVTSLFLVSVTPGIGAGVRYSHPFLYAALIPVGLVGILTTPLTKTKIGLALCLALFIGNWWETASVKLARLADFVRTDEHGFLWDDENVPQVRRAQETIPAGKRVLASVQNGFLLDFTRNPIWSLDLPGMVSPPPGLPITPHEADLHDFLMNRSSDLPSPYPSEQVLDYLRRCGVDVLAFQRRHGSVWYLRRDDVPAKPVLARTIFAIALTVHKQLADLIGKCPILYDDGDLIVLDLARTTPPLKSGRG